MRARFVAAGVAALMVLGGTVAFAAADSTPVECTIAENTLSCPLPEPAAPVTETATAPPVTVTETVTVSSAAPASSTPAATTTAASSTPPATTTTAPPPAAGWPDASTTGARGTLTPKSGTITATAGQVIENIDLSGQIRVGAANVTIRNVKIRTSDYWGVRVTSASGSVTIEDATIVGTGNTLACVGGPNATMTRVDCSGAQDGVKMDGNTTLQDSYLHDLATCNGCHYDGVELWDDNVKILHNRILNQHGQTSAIFIGDGQTNILVENNFLAGGGYTLYGSDGKGNPPTNVTVKNNVWSKQYHTKGGYYGPVVYWFNTGGNSWSGNRWEDGTPLNP